MAKVYGIDLGTTNSSIASFDGRQVDFIHPQNAVMGGDWVPSVIYYERETGKPVVGASARNALGSPRETSRIVTFTKRYMGQENYPEKILIQNERVSISPVEGSACILHHLLSCANEESLGNGGITSNKAVITIPAAFSNKQRECTKLAAELAGIEVLGLVHEPTAAAISYGISSGDTVLVFDLGGGTLDVSIVKNNRGDYKVLAAAGDSDVLQRNIGGKDWDDKLLELAINQHGYELGRLPNLSKETELWQLKKSVEECKVCLSTMQEGVIYFPDFTSETITRADFVRYTDNLVEDCLKVVKAAIDKADSDSTSGPVRIDRCVLAGGSSNMPEIKRRLSSYLADRIANGRSESQWLHLAKPERAIVEGAARYAYMLANEGASDNGVLVGVEEKSSHSYGTKQTNSRTGDFEVRNLILSTDPMIVDSRPFSFFTMKDKQSGVVVDLFENNSTDSRIPFSDQLNKIYEKDYVFDNPENVKRHTKVSFIVSRNRDGIISIRVESEGHHSEDFEIATVFPPITDEQKRHIVSSIQLMDLIPEDCK